jgi:hypothetical protein
MRAKIIRRAGEQILDGERTFAFGHDQMMSRERFRMEP